MKRNGGNKNGISKRIISDPTASNCSGSSNLSNHHDCFSLPVCKDAGVGWNPPGLLPKWLQIFVTEEAMMKVIDKWFEGVKDLLDDGRVNGSQK